MATDIQSQLGGNFGAGAKALLDWFGKEFQQAGQALGLDGIETKLDKLMASPSPLDRFTTPAGSAYEVKRGDTLGAIAARSGTDVATLARLNNLADPDRLSVGQTLTLPGAATPASHTVKSGETLTAIARAAHTDVGTLATLNRIADPDKLAVGEQLALPGATGRKTAAAAPNTAAKPAAASQPVATGTPTAGATPSTGGMSDKGLQFLYQHEAQAGVSNHLHWPKAASGVTLGPGYDMKHRSKDEITADLTRIGIDPAAARKAAEGAGLTGAAAKAFARDNHDLISLSKDQEKQLLTNTVQGYADHVRSQIKVPVTQNQFDAMVSFAYNIGTPRFDGSTALKRLNAGDKDGAAEAMTWWNKSEGKVNQGLINRRNDEVALFKSASAPLAAAPATTKAATPANDKAPVGGTSAADLARVIETRGDAQAKADLAAGRKVVVALRTDTNANANGGKGQYDDTIAIVWKGADGALHARTFAGNTEPSGQYSTEGPKASKGSSVDMNGDGKNDLGRLAAGTIRYTQQSGNFLGNTFFRADRTQVAERDTNHDGAFDAKDANRIDKSGAGRSMLIHQGGAGNTWSAGCQTLPKDDFNAFVSALGGQKAFSYVLVNAK